MSITEQERNELHNTLQEALGSGPASTLMSYLPPVGWADVATKRDIDSLRTATTQDIDALRAATKHEIDTLRTEMQGGFNEVRAELYRAMNAQTKGLFFSVAGLNVTIAGLVLAALRFT